MRATGSNHECRVTVAYREDERRDKSRTYEVPKIRSKRFGEQLLGV